jgi:hypothetical protein
MSRTIEIDCPYHHQRETITLPDSYAGTFEGDIPCGAEDEKATLHIKLMGGGNSPKIAKLRLVKEAPPRIPEIRITGPGGEPIDP